MDIHLIRKHTPKPIKKYSNAQNLYSCLVKGFLCFFLLSGVIGIYTSAFGISFSALRVYPILFAACILLAFLYFNNTTLNLGYLLFFAVYLACAIHWYAPANSGFSAIRNITYDVIDKIYQFPALQYSRELIPDRSYTIPIALIVVGIGYAAIINVLISGYMSAFWSIFLSAPVVIIPLYFDQTPSMLSVFLLLFSWIVLIMFRYTGKYRLYKKQQNEKIIVNEKTKQTTIRFATNGPALFQTASLFLTLTVMIGIGTAALLPSGSLRFPASWSQYKNTTDEYVRTFMIRGFNMFYDRYSAGGLNGGELGQTGSVRPDFETDLEVWMIPCTNDRFYLRGYVGNQYVPVKNRWDFETVFSDSEAVAKFPEYAAGFDDFPSFLNNPVLYMPEASTADALLTVKNVGANPQYLYTPYFETMHSLSAMAGAKIDRIEDWSQGFFPMGSSNHYHYHPYTSMDFSTFDYYSEPNFTRRALEGYESLVKDKDSIYLSVPEEDQEIISQICKDGNFQGTPTEIARQVASYFSNHYPYTLKPGRTPNNTDFVEYFLAKNKKGYCAHFASSAVLIFRNLGIPSRYVEGYAIDSADIANSEVVEKEDSALTFFYGENPIENAQTVKIEVNDSSAHAWAEIYLDGFGWVPVEVTPASMGYDDEDEDLLAGLAQFFRNAMGRAADADSADGLDADDFDINMQQKNLETAAIAILVPALIICLAFFLSSPAKNAWKRYQMTHTKDRNKNIAAFFLLVADAAGKTQALSGEIREHAPNAPFYIQLLVAQDFLDESQGERYQALVEQASYSPDALTDEQYRDAEETSRMLLKKLGRLHRRELMRGIFHRR